MPSLKEHTSAIRDVYAEALLSARLRGIEGLPAKRLALAEAVAAVNGRYGVAASEDEVRRLLRVSDRAPFSMVMADAAPARARADEPAVDQRVHALLTELNATVRGAKV
jgi:hypothetical protein